MGNDRIVFDREVAEYRNLCASLWNLHDVFLGRKEEIRKLLEETAARKREAFIVLIKANRLMLHLSSRQRQIANVTYGLGEIKARIKEANALVFPNGKSDEKAEIRPEFQADWKNRRELKQKGLLLVSLIDGIKRKLLQLDLVEMRCRELILAVKKVMEAFHCEFKSIRKKLYPFGVFSLFHRSLRRLFGSGYFTPRDLDEVAALGKITGLVLKIADAPVV